MRAEQTALATGLDLPLKAWHEIVDVCVAVSILVSHVATPSVKHVKNTNCVLTTGFSALK